MSLIPGSLPSDTCYGTPQELLELFAQYLDIPAYAVSSKVLYSSVDPSPNTDFLWVDTITTASPVLKVYNNGAYREYPFEGSVSPARPETLINGKTAITTLVAGDQLLVSQAGTSPVLKKITVSDARSSIGRIVQVVEGSTTTSVTSTSAAFVNTGLTVTITPKHISNKVLILISQDVDVYRAQSSQGAFLKVLRTVSAVDTTLYTGINNFFISVGNSTSVQAENTWTFQYLDSPNTTSATSYRVQGQILYTANSGQIEFQSDSSRSSILAIEVTP